MGSTWCDWFVVGCPYGCDGVVAMAPQNAHTSTHIHPYAPTNTCAHGPERPHTLYGTNIFAHTRPPQPYVSIIGLKCIHSTPGDPARSTILKEREISAFCGTCATPQTLDGPILIRLTLQLVTYDTWGRRVVIGWSWGARLAEMGSERWGVGMCVFV